MRNDSVACSQVRNSQSVENEHLGQSELLIPFLLYPIDCVEEIFFCNLRDVGTSGKHHCRYSYNGIVYIHEDKELSHEKLFITVDRLVVAAFRVQQYDKKLH